LSVSRSGDIFFARSDDPWILSGAAVHISFVGQDDGTQTGRELDGQPTTSINPNLTTGIDFSKAQRLPENLGISFMGDTKGGPFDIDAERRRAFAQPNPDGRSCAVWSTRGSTARTSADARAIGGSSTSVSTPEREAGSERHSVRTLNVKPTRPTTSDRRTQNGGGPMSRRDPEYALLSAVSTATSHSFSLVWASTAP
jgi:hypothetical protein